MRRFDALTGRPVGHVALRCIVRTMHRAARCAAWVLLLVPRAVSAALSLLLRVSFRVVCGVDGIVLFFSVLVPRYRP